MSDVREKVKKIIVDHLGVDADKVTDKIKLQFDVDFERSNNKYENQDNVFISKRNR